MEFDLMSALHFLPSLIFLTEFIYKDTGRFKITAHNKYCRKKMSSLEKDRRDLQSTIDALQEGNQT